MAASVNDYFTKVNNGTVAEPAQLSAPKTTVDTTASLSLSTGWPTDTGINIAIFKTGTDGTVTDGTVTYWKATLTGTTLSNMTLKGGTNQNYTTGDSVVILSPYQFNDMVSGMLVEHNNDGTHSSISLTGNIDVNDSSTAIRDTSDNELLKFSKTASAVNEVTVANAATGNGPTISATGGDTNIDLNLSGKGAGKVKLPAANKTTDANGWTVYDFGAWKEYRKRTTYSQTFSANTPTSLSLSSSNLPSGMSTLGSNYLNATVVQSSNAYELQWVPEMGASSNSLIMSVISINTGARSGLVDWVIVSA